MFSILRKANAASASLLLLITTLLLVSFTSGAASASGEATDSTSLTANYADDDSFFTNDNEGKKSKYSFYALGSNRALLGEINILIRPVLANTDGVFADKDEEFLSLSSGYQHNAVIVGKPNDKSHPKRLYMWGSSRNHQIFSHDEAKGEESTVPKPTEVKIDDGFRIITMDLTGDITCLLLERINDVTPKSRYRVKCFGDIQFSHFHKPWEADIEGDRLLQEGEELKKIVISKYHVILFGTKSSTICAGSNFYGQCGDGNKSVMNPLIEADQLVNANLTAEIENPENVVDVEVGPFSTFFLTKQGKLYHSGKRSHNQGNPFEADALPTIVTAISQFNITQISVADSFTAGRFGVRMMLIVFLTNTGAVYTWNYDLPFKLIPVEPCLGHPSEDFKYTRIFAGSTNFISLMKLKGDSDHIYIGTQGANEFGETEPDHVLSNNNQTHIWDWKKFQPHDHIVDARMGSGHAVVMSKKHIWAWGDNSVSQCAQEHPPAVMKPKKLFEFSSPVRSIIGSRMGALMVTESGESYGYGINSVGNLGLPTLKVAHTPKAILPEYFQGHRSGDDNKDDNQIEAATISIDHSLFSTKSGRVYGVGKNEYCRLGSNITQTFKPVLIDVPGKVIAVENGFFHSMMLSAPNKGSPHDPNGHGVVWTMGMNGMGQLGVGTSRIFQSCEPLIVKFEDGEGKTLLSPDETITQIAAGEFHSTALTSHGQLYSWGQDGTSSEDTIWKPVRVETEGILLNHERITKASCGTDFTIFITTEKRVFGYGSNKFGNIDGLSNDEDPSFVPSYEKPFDITNRFRSLGVISSEESVIDAAAGHYSAVVYTNHSRLIHFGSLYHDEEDSRGIHFVNGTNIHSQKFECENWDSVKVSAGNSVAFIICEEQSDGAGWFERNKLLIFTAIGVFAGVFMVLIGALVIVAFRYLKQRREAKKNDPYSYTTINDEGESEAVWEDGRINNSIFDEGLIESDDPENGASDVVEDPIESPGAKQDDLI